MFYVVLCASLSHGSERGVTYILRVPWLFPSLKPFDVVLGTVLGNIRFRIYGLTEKCLCKSSGNNEYKTTQKYSVGRQQARFQL